MTSTGTLTRSTVQIAYGPAPKATAPKAPKPRQIPQAPKGLEFDRMFDAGRIVWVGDVATWR